jgi:23S rRNA pseudouridine1911/1915/1917 synthase
VGTHLIVAALERPERLDKFLIREFPRSSRNYWRRHLEKTVTVDGCQAAKGQLLKGGERIEFSRTPPADELQIQANPSLTIPLLYEDEHCLAFDKPAGIPCHPLRAEETETVVNAVLAKFPDQAKLLPRREAGLAHRLDNETSGVLLFARSNAALERLQALSRNGEMLKIYLAVVAGRLEGRGEIAWPIAHDPKNASKMVAVRDAAAAERLRARPAHTRYESLRADTETSLVRLSLPVGARHQIRVHCAALGHPILGDRVYGTRAGQRRHFLHAAELRFRHPWTGAEVRIAAPLPPEFSRFGAPSSQEAGEKRFLFPAK